MSNHSAAPSGFTAFALRLGAIGDRPGDSEIARLQHRLLVFMGALMACGGILWGTIAAYFDLFLPAIVPYGYTLLTVVNFAWFRVSRQFAAVRNFQVFISLLLPFLFQWSLGGFAPSGAVMLWAMLALVGSMTFSESAATLKWLLVYSALAVVSGVLDPYVAERFAIPASDGVRTAFFVVNVVIISNIVFGLSVYLLGQRDAANRALEAANRQISAMNERLEDEVAARTRELRAALAQSQAILDNMADGLIAVDADGRVRAANPASFGLLSGPGRAETVGRPAAEVLPGELATLLARAMDAGEVMKAQVLLPNERVGAAVASPIQNGNGNGSHGGGSVVIVRDVTLEREIDRMKTDFIATVSHELRTPLTSVLGFAKVTRNKLDTGIFPLLPEADRRVGRGVEQVRGNLDIIISEGERLTALINDVLDISKMEAGRMEWKLEPLDPAALVDRALEATAALFQGGTVEVRREVELELPTLSGDRDRLLQVLINLLSNAAKFTDHGSVTLAARAVPGGVEFSVADTGPGIDVSDQAAIFEKFKQVGDTLTNKPKGSGLGLPICKQIVTAHGGHIGVRSRPGQGATFHVVLPTGEVVEPPAGPPAIDEIVRQIERHVGTNLPDATGSILVVDDDANLRELLRQQLGDRGYEIRQAANGYAAIEAVRERRPDLIILDVMMPGISGFDVAAVLKSDPATEGIPIIILSIVQDTDRGYRLGVDKYLTKPTESGILDAEIQRLLQQARSHRRVLVVDKRMPVAPDVIRLLEAKGYNIVGTCTGDACLEQAVQTRPDLIVLAAADESGHELLRAIRLERELEHVYVVHLMGNGGAAADPDGAAEGALEGGGRAAV